MKLRPRGNRSGEGCSRQQRDDFDDADYDPFSDSDHSSVSDKAEDLLSLLEDNEGETPLYQEDDVVDSDCDEKGVVRLGRKRGRPRRKEAKLLEDGRNVGEVNIEELDLHLGVGATDVPRPDKRRKKKRHYPPLLWECWEEEDERWLDENMTKNIDLENQNEAMNKTAEVPSDLTLPLLRYQKEWLAWALEQEQSAIKGGILADEMGMGKTIQAIALVLARREISRSFDLLGTPASSTELPEIKCTLVICPVVAVMQWVNEIDRFTAKGSTKVLVYHGANRGKNILQFAGYDFVITTYSVVESDYRRNVMPPKQKCQYCGKLLSTEKMSVHLKYFCGPDAVRTEKQSKQSRKGAKHAQKMKYQETLSDEDETCDFKGAKSKGVQNKSNKLPRQREDIFEADSTMEDRLKRSILHSVKWERIILDEEELLGYLLLKKLTVLYEAHFIKDRRCNTAKAILALQSSYKWALSGTPLQNRVGELYSLVRFLRILPYSYYLCKDCDCRILDYCSSKECSNCPHKSMRHFCWWNRSVATPIQAGRSGGDRERAMFFLRNKILKSIVLRRTKKGRAADLALPPTIISLRRDALDIKEEDYYKSLYNESQAQFNTYVEAGTVMNNYAHIFDLLTRLRQAVDHPYLVVHSRTAALRNESSASTDNNEKVCGLCHDPLEDPVVTSCGHAFCKGCLVNFSADLGQVSCPSCSKPLSVDLTTKVDNLDHNCNTSIQKFKAGSILNRIRLNDFQTSTKIEALREEIRFMIERDGSAKGIVFSQFTSFLDLINYSLQKSGVMCVQLVGSMSMAAREDAISKFTKDPDCRIFLMSLKAGGVALNLTVASHVFLMDPWWNPAVERQAQDRIHRIGQYKPIRIVRFVIENSIEERILKLQEKKELVFEGTVGGSAEALGKLTEADMKFLFVT